MATRREFVKSGCLVCLGGVAGIGTLLEACSPKMLPILQLAAQNAPVLKVSADKFIVEKTNLLIVRSADLEHEILLVKKNEGGYQALYLQCTHEGLSLTPTSSQIYCTAHGSAFDFEGNVLIEPALKPLKKFKTELVNEEIVIHLI